MTGNKEAALSGKEPWFICRFSSCAIAFQIQTATWRSRLISRLWIQSYNCPFKVAAATEAKAKLSELLQLIYIHALAFVNHMSSFYWKAIAQVADFCLIYSRRKTSSKILSRFSVGSNLKSCRKVIFFSALSILLESRNFRLRPQGSSHWSAVGTI